MLYTYPHTIIKKFRCIASECGGLPLLRGGRSRSIRSLWKSNCQRERRDESAFKEVGGLETEVFQAEGSTAALSGMRKTFATFIRVWTDSLQAGPVRRIRAIPRWV